MRHLAYWLPCKQACLKADVSGFRKGPETPFAPQARIHLDRDLGCAAGKLTPAAWTAGAPRSQVSVKFATLAALPDMNGSGAVWSI